jgi:succinate dehydrogenase hydrophobic anchor subunit
VQRIILIKSNTHNINGLNYVYEDQINTMLDINSEIGKILNEWRRSIEKRS